MRLNQSTPEEFELTPGESRPDSLFHFSTRQQFLFLGWMDGRPVLDTAVTRPPGGRRLGSAFLEPTPAPV